MSKKNKINANPNDVDEQKLFLENITKGFEGISWLSKQYIDVIDKLINTAWVEYNYDPRTTEKINLLKIEVQNYKQQQKNSDLKDRYIDPIKITNTMKMVDEINFIIFRPKIDDLLKDLEQSYNEDDNVKKLVDIIKSLKDLDTDKDYELVVKKILDYKYHINILFNREKLIDHKIESINKLLTINNQEWISYAREYINDLENISNNFYDANRELRILQSEIDKFSNKLSCGEFNYDHNVCLTHIKNSSLYLRNCIETIIDLLIIANKEKLDKEKFKKIRRNKVLLDILVSCKEEINIKLNTFEWIEFDNIMNKKEFDFADKDNHDKIENNYGFLSDNLHHKNIFQINKTDPNMISEYDFYYGIFSDIKSTYEHLIEIYEFINKFKNHFYYFEKNECLICVKNFRLLTFVSKKLFN